MNSNEIRRAILELLKEEAELSGCLDPMVEPETFMKKLNISESALNLNIDYLEKKRYVRLIKTLGSFFTNANITPDGLDIVSDPLVLEKTFPVHTINVTNTGNIGAIGSNITLSNSFNYISDMVNDSVLSKDDKEEFLSLLRELFEALPQKKAEPQKVVSFLGKLLTKAGETAAAQAVIIFIQAIQNHFF